MTVSSRPHLRRPESLLEVQRAGLFRSTQPFQVLAGFGVIFKQGLFGLLEAGKCNARFPTIEQVQGAGAYVYGNSEETQHVDVFISHSWSAGRWAKYLALCLFFNLTLATWSSIAVWFVMATALVAKFGATGIGGSSFAFPCLVCAPMATFFLVFIFGHDLYRQPLSLWLDKLCVHQTNFDLKQEQIASLPVFVAHSSRMVILWDETYFERLWCNLELATFAHHRGMEKVELLPVWLAPWLLCSVLLDFLSACLFEVLEHVMPSYTSAWVKTVAAAAGPLLGRNPVMSTFVGIIVIVLGSGIQYVPVSIPSFFSFQLKLRNHELLLDQMAAFDIRAAKCTLPSDREAIERQVAALFERTADVEIKGVSAVDEGEVRLQRFVLEALDEDNGDPYDRFNAHVRGPLRSQVISQIGSAVNVPWQMAFIAFLPMIFYSSVNVLACDNADCETSAANVGMSSVSEYMGSQTLAWLISDFILIPAICPILLRMINWTLSFGDGPCQLSVALLCCPLAYFYIYTCGGMLWGSLFCFVEYRSPIQLLIFLVIVTILILQSIYLFSNRDMGPNVQGQQSCRCVTRHAGASETLPLCASE